MLNTYANKEFPTLTNIAKRLDPGGKVDKIVEIMNQVNPILTDMAFIEGNLPTGHKTTVRTSLPTGNWRQYNDGVPTEKSTTQQITDTCGMLESYAEVDKALADLNGNTAEFRLSEDRAFIEGMSQTMAETLFYGDTAIDPKKFQGLTPRYNSFDRASFLTADYVLDGGGSSNANNSIWLVGWGENSVHGIYPKGSTQGLHSEDLGQKTITGVNGQFEGYRTHYKWDIGLTVRDYRQVVRIANIDRDTVTVNEIVRLMIEAAERLHNADSVRPVFYMNRKMRTLVRQLLVQKQNIWFTWENYEGRKILTFDEFAVERCDALDRLEPNVV